MGTTVLEPRGGGVRVRRCATTGPLRGGRVPRMRGGGRGAARAAGGVRVPDHELAQVKTHTRKVRQRGGTSSTCCSRRTTASATAASGTTTASCSRWRRSTASISTGSATSPSRRCRKTSRATRSSATWTSASCAAAACARASTSRRSACWSRRPQQQDGVSTFLDKPLGEVVCINCGQCINRCPTAPCTPTTRRTTSARHRRPHQARRHPAAPSPRAGIGECFGCAPGTPMTYQMNTG